MKDKINYVYDYDQCSYVAKKKFSSGNTVEVEFFLGETSSEGPMLVEVGLRSFAKRKHKAKPDFEFSETGRDALEPAIWATQCLLEFPAMLLSEPYYLHKNRLIYTIFWSNARRRNIYHKWLSRYGFYFDMNGGQKCLMKIYDRG